MKLFKKHYYESLFAKKEKGIADYYEEIRSAQGKIEEIRSKCPHANVEVHMYMWRPGAMTPQRICTSCDAVVPGVTQVEESIAWAEWKKNQESFSSGVTTFVQYPSKKD